MKLALTTIVVSNALLLAACGKEQGRVPFTAATTSTGTVTLQAGEVAFWTDLSIEYEGNAALSYEVELSQGGTVVAKTTCDPLGRISVKTSWVETNIGDKHSRSGNGKMDCAVTLAKAGPTAVKAKLAFARKPASVSLKKADLVLRQ